MSQWVFQYDIILVLTHVASPLIPLWELYSVVFDFIIQYLGISQTKNYYSVSELRIIHTLIAQLLDQWYKQAVTDEFKK